MWSTSKVTKELRYLFPEESHAMLYEVRNRTGFSHGGRERYADAIAMSLWPSRGLDIIGVEVKTSRGDWEKELADPSKSEAFMQYCDKWYLAVGDKDIVKEGELPPTWGLIAPKRTRLGIVKQAPKLTPKDIPRFFLASLLRAANKGHNEVLAGLVDEKVKDRLESFRTSQVREITRLKKDYDDLRNTVKEFEKASGLVLQGWAARDPKELGLLVRYVKERGAGLIRQEAMGVRNLANKLVTAADAVAEACDSDVKMEDADG